MVLGGQHDVLVHRHVRMMCGSQREPPDVLHAGRLECSERRLDVPGIEILEVVVADGDDDVRPELRAHLVRELDDVRRLDAVREAARLVDAAARGRLHVEVDPAAQDRHRGVVVRHAVRDRVADHGHVLERRSRCAAGGRTESERNEHRNQCPPHALDRSGVRKSAHIAMFSSMCGLAPAVCGVVLCVSRWARERE
jgi:hypothetical protein